MSPETTAYVRYRHADATSYGVLEDELVYRVEGSPFGPHSRTGESIDVADVALLAPCEPSKVIAVGLNYASHLGARPTPQYPGIFSMFPSSIVGPGDEIVMPADAEEVHYEGELVVVIGKTAKHVSAADAGDHVFGVTAGNDVSERVWQRNDLQWFRAKGADTFAPIGPAIVAGLDYNDLLVETRVNGEVRQSEGTKDLIFPIDEIVAYISRYVTLLPGDVIFTGTPGSTRGMEAGDVVEVEVEGVGVLRNTVVRAR